MTSLCRGQDRLKTELGGRKRAIPTSEFRTFQNHWKIYQRVYDGKQPMKTSQMRNHNTCINLISQIPLSYGEEHFAIACNCYYRLLSEVLSHLRSKRSTLRQPDRDDRTLRNGTQYRRGHKHHNKPLARITNFDWQYYRTLLVFRWKYHYLPVQF